jgi:HD-GYP domain-containing protein (c-di-GMP phosphodiesterase class II)
MEWRDAVPLTAEASRQYSLAARPNLERFVAASLYTLLNAIDANDPETGSHVRRVATYAQILAEAADLPERERRLIEHVALFHDVGKIHEAVFDIVHDGHPLSAADREAIATHPHRGAKVLSPLRGFYPDLLEGVLAHHERWDGRGYPRALHGRQIPLAARIIAIVDTFDAVTYHRRYRDGRSTTIARDVILNGRGEQFDPDLVDLFDFPPVFTRIVAMQRRVLRWKRTVGHRRTGWDDGIVPYIPIRWRARCGGRQRRSAYLP